MRVGWVLVVLAVTSTAHGDPGLFEYSTETPIRPARVLVEAHCEVDVAVRGAVVDVEVHQRLVNTGSEPLAATEELALPDHAQLVGFAIRDRTTEVALPVAASSPSQSANPEVVGVDPAIVKQVSGTYHVVVQPLARDREATLVMHWTAFAEVTGGALRVVLPGRPDQPACRGRIHATPGPGATVKRIRVDHTELTRSGEFDLGEHDATLEVELAFARPTPIAWTQTEALGDGFTARALTVLAPPVAQRASRVLLVIDGSRSMELVGRDHVDQVVRAIVAALPPGAELEAIVYDRTATRVLGAWRAVDAVPEIVAAIDHHIAGGGSDLVAALALAQQIAAGQPTSVIAITDGVLAELPVDSLHTTGDVSVHAIVLDPPDMHASGRAILVDAASRSKGSYIELEIDDLDAALHAIADWLAPAWFQLAAGDRSVPDEVFSGSGFVATSIVRSAKSVVVRGRGFSVTAHDAPRTAIAQLVLANATDRDFATAGGTEGGTDGGGDAARRAHANVNARHPAVDADHSLAVLSMEGRVAHSRRDVVAGGGPYTRTIAFEDPPVRVSMSPTPTRGPSVLDRQIIHRLLVDELQPRAFTCYERALGHAPDLGGLATIQLELSRGEVTRATTGGLGDPTFDACLLDAAYSLVPPLPTPGFNLDDRVLVHYALTFTVRDQHPLVIPGDADSSTPIDIDAIQAGVARPQLDLDTRTPLGNLRVP